MLGNHPRSSEHVAAFAYSLGDLPGYTGPAGPFTIELTHNKPNNSKMRQQIHLERDIPVQKAAELAQARHIRPAPGYCQFASAEGMSAKKDAGSGQTSASA